MLCNISYSSILYWNYGTLCIKIEAPVCTAKHQQNSLKFCGSQIIICIKYMYNNTMNHWFLSLQMNSVFLNTFIECHALP